MNNVFGLLSGLVFGLGLILAGMTQPLKVRPFWTWPAPGTPAWPW